VIAGARLESFFRSCSSLGGEPSEIEYHFSLSLSFSSVSGSRALALWPSPRDFVLFFKLKGAAPPTLIGPDSPAAEDISLLSLPKLDRRFVCLGDVRSETPSLSSFFCCRRPFFGPLDALWAIFHTRLRRPQHVLLQIWLTKLTVLLPFLLSFLMGVRVTAGGALTMEMGRTFAETLPVKESPFVCDFCRLFQVVTKYLIEGVPPYLLSR